MRHMRLMLALVGVGVLMVGGCSDEGGGSSGVVACEEFWAEGVTTTKAMFDEACDRDGQLVYQGSATVACADGRELRWNDEGWGFMGEPWNHHEGVERVAPESVWESCDG